MISRVSTPAGVVAVTPVTRLPPLSVGDVIAARVAKHLGDGVMRLAGNAFQMDVQGQQMFPVGARVALHVEKGPTGPQYQVRAEPNAVPTTTTPETAALNRLTALATNLATDQDGMSPLFAGLSATMAASAGPRAPIALPPALMNAIAAVLGLRVSGDASLDGTKLKQGLQQLTSAASATRGAAPGGLLSALEDLSSVLKALVGDRGATPRQTTPPPPPGLAQHPQGQAPMSVSAELAAALARGNLDAAAALLLGKTDAALARARLAALVSSGLAGDTDGAGERGAFERTLDLPFTYNGETGVLSLQIGQDETPGRDGEGAHTAWRLRFGLDVPATGPVEAVVGLDGVRLFVTLWVEQADTRSTLRGRLDDLRGALSEIGLEIMDLRVLAGRPSNPPAVSGKFVDRTS